MTVTKLGERQPNRQYSASADANRSTSHLSSRKKRERSHQEELPKLEFGHNQRLSLHLIDLIDALTDAQHDWISQLHHDWEVDLRTFNLLSAGKNAVLPKTAPQRIGAIVPKILPTHYQPMMIAQQMHWVYTCCLHIRGLGRVRIVIDFNSSQLTGEPVIFATNRLDWSPGFTLTQWFQRRPFKDICSEESPQGLLVEAFTHVKAQT